MIFNFTFSIENLTNAAEVTFKTTEYLKEPTNASIVIKVITYQFV